MRRLVLAVFALATASVAHGQTCPPDPPDFGAGPVLIGAVLADYPAEARAAGAEGRVVVRARVAVDGRVAEAGLLRGVHALLDSSALAAVRAARFVPSVVGGTTVEACVAVPVRFGAARSAAPSPVARADSAGADAGDSARSCRVLVLPRPVATEQPWFGDLRREGVEGRVIMRARVAVDGRVAETAVAESDHEKLVKPVEEALRAWRFAPATCDGVPFEAWATIPFRYRVVETVRIESEGIRRLPAPRRY